MLKLHEIRRVHVELTTRCNARCPFCPRNYRGFPYNSDYPTTELTLEDFKKIFTLDFLTQLRSPLNKNSLSLPPGVSFNGNLGDFSSARDGVEIVRYLTDNNVRVFINTNGSARSPDWWANLAHPNVEIGFAIDGLKDTHKLYRQDTDWDRIMENAQAFINAGGRAIWRFVPFDHNRHQEEDCKIMADLKGFARFENIYDGRDNTPVYNREGKFTHWIGPQWPGGVPLLNEMLESHKTWFKIETVQSSKDKPNVEFFCIHKRQQEIYIAADGSVYPCCYLGFYPGQMHHAGNEQLVDIVRENNALEFPLEHCLAWFDRVEETWAKSSIKDGRLYQCVNSCGR